MQVGAVVSTPASQVCSPVAGMGSPPCCSVQREHCITAVVPSSPQVAGTSGVTSTLKSWSSAGMVSVVVASQTVHVKVFTPAVVQVGAVVSTPASQLWPAAAMGSVLVASLHMMQL